MPVKGRIAVAVLAALALSACASIKDHRGYLVDAPLLDSVQPGIDNQIAVNRVIGQPNANTLSAGGSGGGFAAGKGAGGFGGPG